MSRMTQHRVDDFTNWALRIGAYRMNADGSITDRTKRYSPDQLRKARELTRAKRFLAEKKAQAIIQEAIDAGCQGLTDERLTIEAKPVV